VGPSLNARDAREDERLPPVCILAGGRGTRLGELTRDLPKPLIPVAGRPFIEHQLELLRWHGARRIVMCVGYLGEQLEAAVGDGSGFGLEVEYSYDGPSLAGTAGAIRNALPLLDESFLILYGDTYLRIDYQDVVRAFERSGLPALMSVYKNRGRLDVSNAVYSDGRVLAYDKKSPPPGAEWIDYGLSVLHRSALEGTQHPELADVQRELAARNLLAGYPTTQRFYEIGTPESLREADRFLRRARPWQPGPESPRDDWDRHWADYAAVSARNPAQQYRRRLILSLLERSGPPARLLDIGSGSGELAAAVTRAFPGVEILGLDVSEAAVDIARRKLPGATFQQVDLLRANEPEARYRGWATHAVCSEVLEHLEQPEQFLSKARPYLGDGCVVVLTVPGGPMSAYDRHIGHRGHYTTRSLRALLERAGYAVERVTASGFPFFNLYRLLVIARGERLVEEAARDGGDSPLARLATGVFRILFRFNLERSRWGWQIVAVARPRTKVGS
jgi:dTDP-glucose pyrophosphorylase/SAM-dependent methyltransferase